MTKKTDSNEYRVSVYLYGTDKPIVYESVTCLEGTEKIARDLFSCGVAYDREGDGESWVEVLSPGRIKRVEIREI